jgi:hypothetical protein
MPACLAAASDVGVTETAIADISISFDLPPGAQELRKIKLDPSTFLMAATEKRLHLFNDNP